jgi:hypothetical protein
LAAISFFQTIEAFLDDGQIAQEKLRFRVPKIADRIDGFPRMGNRRVSKGSDNQKQRVGGPEFPQELLAEAGFTAVPRRHSGQLGEFDRRLNFFLRLVDLGQAVDPVVRNLDYGHGLGPVSRGLRRRHPGQGGEKNGLAGKRRTNKADFHNDLSLK